MQLAEQPSYAVSAGHRYRCPICTAKTLPPQKVGDSVILLNGFRSGLIGTVSKVDLGSDFRQGTFLIRVDDKSPCIEHVVDPEVDVFAPSAGFVLPDWFPPLSSKECAELHSVVLEYVNKTALPTSWFLDRVLFYEIIRYAWAKRLPLQAIEIWRFLFSHGVPSQYEAEMSKLFEEGTELLVYAVGRRPIKKKRQNKPARRDA